MLRCINNTNLPNYECFDNKIAVLLFIKINRYKFYQYFISLHADVLNSNCK